MILRFNVNGTTFQNWNNLCLLKFFLLEIRCIINTIYLKTALNWFFFIKITVFIFNIDNIDRPSRRMRSLIVCVIFEITFLLSVLLLKIFKRMVVIFINFYILIAIYETLNLTRFWFNKFIHLKQSIFIFKLLDFILQINLKHFLIVSLYNLVGDYVIIQILFYVIMNFDLV